MTGSPQERALNELLEMVGDADAAGTPSNEARARTLAMQWPSLAAALANLLAAHDMRVPRPLRIAAMTLRQETVVELPTEDNRAVAGMGTCARCGHVQHQHSNKWPSRCGLCRCAGWQVKFERTPI